MEGGPEQPRRDQSLRQKPAQPQETHGHGAGLRGSGRGQECRDRRSAEMPAPTLPQLDLKAIS